jgi:hypothetical protein
MARKSLLQALPQYLAPAQMYGLQSLNGSVSERLKAAPLHHFSA